MSPTELTPILNRLGIPDGNPDPLGAIMQKIDTLESRAVTPPDDYRNPVDVATIRQLRRDIGRIEPLLDALEVPDDATDPVAAAVARVSELQDAGGDSDDEDKLWVIPRYVLAGLFALGAIILLFVKAWLGVAVLLGVAVAIVVNIRSKKQKVEMVAEMVGFGSLLGYIVYLLLSLAVSATAVQQAANPDGSRPPAADAPPVKSEAQRLQELLTGTKAGIPMEFPDYLYAKVEVRGNVVRVPKLTDDVNWGLVLGGKQSMIREGKTNVTVDGEYLVYTSTTPLTGGKLYLDPVDRAKEPSKARDLPASK